VAHEHSVDTGIIEVAFAVSAVAALLLSQDNELGSFLAKAAFANSALSGLALLFVYVQQRTRGVTPAHDEFLTRRMYRAALWLLFLGAAAVHFAILIWVSSTT